MFKRLVEGDNDIVGQIAYSLYKRHKCEFIDEKNPTEEELKAFISSCQTEQAISLYITSANKIFSDLMNNTFSDIVLDAKEDARNDHIKLLAKAIEPIKPKSFWYQVGIGVVTTTIISVLCGLAFLGLIFSKGGLEQVLSEVISKH